MSLLTGKAASGVEDTGETVCACFSIGVNTLREAILRIPNVRLGILESTIL